MNHLYKFLIEGLYYELTHQIVLKILLESNPEFAKEIIRQEYENLQVVMEPRCKGEIYSKKKRGFINSSVRFDLGLREEGTENYTTLIELKMWSPTGENQVKNQMKVTKDKGIQLVYIVIGYPDKMLSDIVNSRKQTDFLYVDLENLIRKLTIFKDDNFFEDYANLLNNDLLHARKKKNISNKKAHIFSCHRYILAELNESGIPTNFYCSNENGGSPSLRCYAEGINSGKSYLEKFNIYLFFKNDSIVIEIYTNPKIETTKYELDEFKKSILSVLPEEIISKKVNPRKKVTEYKKIFEKKLDFKNVQSLNQSVYDFSKLYHILNAFNLDVSQENVPI